MNVYAGGCIPVGGRARALYESGDLLGAARVEADACERDGYDLTAAMLRELANRVEQCVRQEGER